MKLLAFCFALVLAALIAYSQTMAFAWDEGFHILAASLIRHGEKPYIDFVFSQTPLNAYWNAGWMALLGETWRVPHAVAAICTAAACLLTAVFVLRHFPDTNWRLTGALMTLFMVGLNVIVFRFGGISQAYGLCLLAIVAAWQLIPAWPLLAGLACGVAAESSLLTAPIGPIFLIWIYLHSGVTRAARFALGVALAFIPVMVLFAQSPRRVFFGIIEYNLKYRRLGWPDATRQNFQVLISWIDSGPALLLIGLAATGLWFVKYRSTWDKATRSQFYLCAWIATLLGAYIATVKPTFERYFLFTVPFLSVLAVAGVYAIGRKRVAILAVFLTAAGLGKSLYGERDSMTWTDLETTARKVNEVTRPDQVLYADEAIYFLTKHRPPSGMEMRDSHKFSFSPEDSRFYHVFSQAELDRRIKSGVADTLQTCDDEVRYPGLYASKADAGDCTVFFAPHPGALAPNHQQFQSVNSLKQILRAFGIAPAQ